MVRRAVFLWLGLGIFFGFQAELCRAGTEEDLTEKQFVCPFPERTGDVLSLTYAQILKMTPKQIEALPDGALQAAIDKA